MRAPSSVDIYLANLATNFRNHARINVRGSVQQMLDGRLLFVTDRVPSGTGPGVRARGLLRVRCSPEHRPVARAVGGQRHAQDAVDAEPGMPEAGVIHAARSITKASNRGHSPAVYDVLRPGDGGSAR
jgi:hypothetical protein